MNKYCLMSFLLVLAGWGSFLSGYANLPVVIAIQVAVVIGTAAVIAFIEGLEPEIDEITLLDFGPWLIMLGTTPVVIGVGGYTYNVQWHYGLDVSAGYVAVVMAVMSILTTMLAIVAVSVVFLWIGTKFHHKTTGITAPLGFGN